MVEAALMRPGFRGVCIREVQKSLKESAKRLIEDKIRACGLQDVFGILETEIRTPGNGVIIFQGMQNHTADSIKSLEGYDVAWAEEAHSLTDKSLMLLRPTIRKPGSELWFSWNPTRKKDPVDSFFRANPPDNAVSVEASWRDNPWFPDELRRDMAHDRSINPERAAHVWDGEYQIVAEGAYYALQIVDARRSGRIGQVDVDPALLVHTAWDLGIGDDTAIWLWQAAPNGIRVIDYIVNRGQPLAWYAGELAARGHRYGHDCLPHDARARELGTGRTRVETLISLGRNPLVVPLHTVDDGINAVRETLPRCWFDARRCDEGIDALSQYRADYNDELQTFRPVPLHDWTSHAADAFRYLCMAWRRLAVAAPVKPAPQDVEYQILPGGGVASNMSVREIVEMKQRRREREE